MERSWRPNWSTLAIVRAFDSRHAFKTMHGRAGRRHRCPTGLRPPSDLATVMPLSDRRRMGVLTTRSHPPRRRKRLQGIPQKPSSWCIHKRPSSIIILWPIQLRIHPSNNKNSAAGGPYCRRPGVQECLSTCQATRAERGSQRWVFKDSLWERPWTVREDVSGRGNKEGRPGWDLRIWRSELRLGRV